MPKWEMLTVRIAAREVFITPPNIIDIGWMKDRYGVRISTSERITKITKLPKGGEGFDELIKYVGRMGWEPAGMGMSQLVYEILFKRPIGD